MTVQKKEIVNEVSKHIKKTAIDDFFVNQFSLQVA
jgi:hypothetical protein